MNSAVLCISIAKRPGVFGITVHNAAYKALGLNFIYKAFSVTDLEGAIRGVRALGIRGCSVSMPFKEKVISYIDRLDGLAAKVGAVNTIVNNKGSLIGYNTDVFGIYKSLRKFNLNKQDHIVILGTGGAARAALVALDRLKLQNRTISGRNFLQAKKLSKKFNLKTVKWEKRESVTADVLINATPIGMVPEITKMPISKKSIENYHLIMDVVVNPPNTRLINTSKSMGVKTINGLTISLYQASAQFKLYTKKNPPMNVMKKAIKNMFLEK